MATKRRLTTVRYDPHRPVDPAKWLTLDEGEQLLAIERYHKRSRVPLPSRRMHSIIHCTIENQLAEGHEPAKRALERMQAEGLDRHEAVHALGSVLARHLFDTLKEQEPFDRERYAQDLDALTAEQWQQSEADE